MPVCIRMHLGTYESTESFCRENYENSKENARIFSEASLTTMKTSHFHEGVLSSEAELVQKIYQILGGQLLRYNSHTGIDIVVHIDVITSDSYE